MKLVFWALLLSFFPLGNALAGEVPGDIDGNGKVGLEEAIHALKVAANMPVNEPVASGPIKVVDANNLVIGTFVTYDSIINIREGDAYGWIYALTDKNLLTRINTSSGKLLEREVYFQSNNCTGQAYVLPIPGFIAQGMVFDAKDVDPTQRFYFPGGQTLEHFQPFSRLNTSSGGCYEQSFGNINALLAYISDPTVTGITSNIFQAPIILKR